MKKIPCLSVREFDSHDAFTLTDQVTAGCGWALLEGRATVKWHREAWASVRDIVDGTYELCGPRVQGNPHALETHMLIGHGALSHSVHRTFLGIRSFLASHQVEGLVFHHADGRMTKIRRDDYGLPWGSKRGRARCVRLDGVRHRWSCDVVDGLACVCGGGALPVP